MKNAINTLVIFSIVFFSINVFGNTSTSVSQPDEKIFTINNNILTLKISGLENCGANVTISKVKSNFTENSTSFSASSFFGTNSAPSLYYAESGSKNVYISFRSQLKQQFKIYMC